MSGSAKKLLHAAAGSASGDPVYVEDVFNTTLYTGNNSAQTITTGLDISGEGGTIWFKQRESTESHRILTTTSGTYEYLQPDTTGLKQTVSTAGGNNPGFGSVTSTGFTLVADDGYSFNKNDKDMVAWSFREQTGFFDVVKFSTTGGGGTQAISHSLGSIPGFIIIKKTSAAQSWFTFHKSVTSPNSNWWRNWSDLTTAAFDDYFSDDSAINSAPTSTTVTVGSYFTDQTADFIMYVFAEGGSGDQIFGDDGDEAIIKCGSYTGNGNNTGPSVTLGFEPQWLLIKRASAAGTEWVMADNMRGLPVTGSASVVFANSNNSEATNVGQIHPTPTGFNIRQTTGSDLNTNSETYMYIAIRRGPMKEATAGTDLLDIETYTGNGNSTREFSFDITPDFVYQRNLGAATYNQPAIHFRQGSSIRTDGNMGVHASNLKLDRTKGTHLSSSDDKINQNSESYLMYAFKRFPKAIDVLTYESFDETSLSSFNQPHSLGVKPELMMFAPYYVVQGSTSVNGAFKIWWDVNPDNKYNTFFTGNNVAASWLDDPTAAHIPLSSNNNMSFYDVPGPNVKGFIVILMASVDGIIDIGEYTHSSSNGGTVSVTTGFQPRFIVLQNDDNGAWSTFDTVRGISSSGDPLFDWGSTSASTSQYDVFQSISSTGFVIESGNGGNTQAYNTNASRKSRYIAIA